MRKFSLILLVPLLLAACKEQVDNTANNKKMEDSLFSRYPSVNRLTVEVKDHEELYITVGDKTLYNKTKEEQTAIAGEIKEIANHIYSAGNFLKSGKVIFVEEEQTLDVAPGTEKETSIQFSK